MPEPLSDQDQQTLAQWAEQLHSMRAELTRERERLVQADDSTLRAILSDRAGSHIARGTALMLLLDRNRRHRDRTLSDLLLRLWDDPDRQLARMAIEQTPFEPEITERLHALLDDPEPILWSTAASVLARRKDTTIVPRLRAWFRDGDRDHRNVAYSCLCFYGLLEPEQRHALLRGAWDAGGRDDDDWAMLAVGLLELNDRAGWPFLVELAQRADLYSAVWAAETVAAHDPALGLDLMLGILDHGATFQVRWGMVERIARSASLPHVWTSDGLVEARHWVEQRRECLDRPEAESERRSHLGSSYLGPPPPA